VGNSFVSKDLKVFEGEELHVSVIFASSHCYRDKWGFISIQHDM